MKAPADCVRACTERVCTGDLDTSSCLAASAMMVNGCERLLVTVHCLRVSVNIPIDCVADLRKVPEDWGMANNDTDWLGSLDAVHCLPILVKSCRV